jgi:hypothetical protein
MMIADHYRITSALLGVPQSVVKLVAVRLKSDERIPATRPQAAPITPLSLARLILGLCAPKPASATAFERQLGALPRVAGDGAETAELELEAVIAEAAGLTAGGVDFTEGELLIGIDAPAVFIDITRFDETRMERAYQGHAGNGGMTRWGRIPLPTLRRLALELINE